MTVQCQFLLVLVLGMLAGLLLVAVAVAVRELLRRL